MDPAKLKVVELRAELAARGLDQKGVKAVLVSRLQEALDKEEGGGVALTSNVADEDDGGDSQSRQSRSGTNSPTHNRNSDNGSDNNGERNISIINEEDEDEQKSDRDEEDEEENENDDDNQQYDDNVEVKEVKNDDNNDDAPAKNRSSQEANEEDEDVEEDENEANNNEKMETDDKAPSESKNDKSKDGNDEDENDDDKKENDKDEKTDTSDKRDSRKRKRSRSRSGTRSPVPKRMSHRNSPAKNIDDFTNDEDEPEIDPKAVTLNWVDSDLFLKINSRDFCSARPITEGVLGLAWAGARATYGVKDGKVAYEIQITDQNRIVPSLESRNEYELRCGWSVSSHDLQLGESALSFAYGGSAHKATNNEFSSYGCKFGVRDIIGVYLDLDSTPCKIEYTVNGESQGVAFEFDKSELEDKALYPHISTKNLSFKVNFGQCEKLLLSEMRSKSRRHESSRDRRERRRSHDRHRDSRGGGGGGGGHSEDDKSRRTSESEKKKSDESADADKNGDDKNGDDKNGDDKIDEEKSQDDDNKTEGEGDANDEKQAKTEEDEEVHNDVEPEVVEEAKKDDEDIEMKDETKENEEKEEKKDTDCNATPTVTIDNTTIDTTADSTTDTTATAATVTTTTNTTTGDATTENVTPIEKTLLPDYILIGLVSEDKLIIGPVRPASRNDCEVIVLIGLPGAGKTYWAENYANEHLEKRFDILGTKSLLDKMKILGEPRKKTQADRWGRFLEWCTKSVHLLQDLAAKRRRNYILDQTNVFASAQRRKMKGFGDFKRTAIVIVPDDEEYQQRFEKRNQDDCKEHTEYSLNDMKANFSLPSIDYKWFDEVNYSELNEEEAKKKVAEYNEKGTKALPRRMHDDRRMYGRRNDSRHRDDYSRRSTGWSPYGDRRMRDNWRGPPQNWRSYDGGRDRWQGSNNWMYNNRNGGRFDDRRGFDDRNRFGDRGRFDDRGFRNRRDFGSDSRDSRRDDRRTNSRSDRDFRDGNRDRRLGDNRRHSRGVPQKERDEKYDSPPSKKPQYNNSTNQGHWNPNVVGNSGQQNNWNNMSYQQQQFQQQQQQLQQPSQNSNEQQHMQQQQQDWSNWNQQNWAQWQQQNALNGTQNNMSQLQQQQWMAWYKQNQQQDTNNVQWQNWAQCAESYINVGHGSQNNTTNNATDK